MENNENSTILKHRKWNKKTKFIQYKLNAIKSDLNSIEEVKRKEHNATVKALKVVQDELYKTQIELAKIKQWEQEIILAQIKLKAELHTEREKYKVLIDDLKTYADRIPQSTRDLMFKILYPELEELENKQNNDIH